MKFLKQTFEMLTAVIESIKRLSSLDHAATQTQRKAVIWQRFYRLSHIYFLQTIHLTPGINPAAFQKYKIPQKLFYVYLLVFIYNIFLLLSKR